MKVSGFYSLCMLLLLSCSFFSNAQRVSTTNYNGWYMYFGTHKFNKHWGLHAEVQWRRHHWITESQQLLVRTGINYHINDQSTATVGYCFVQTYPYGEFPVRAAFPEHRMWEQLQYKSYINRIEAINRIRLEQRWSYLPVLKDSSYSPGNAVYQNRIRILNRFSIAINSKTIIDNTFYVSTYDELFVNFGKHVANNVFDQNRAYIAVGYKVPKLGRVELGYMNQLLLKYDGIRIENNHTLQAAVFSTIDFIKKQKETIP